MPLERSNGWLTLIDNYTVANTQPNGVFVSYNGMGNVEVNYAGTGVETGKGFEIAADPSALRDIAKSLENMASKIEAKRSNQRYG